MNKEEKKQEKKTSPHCILIMTIQARMCSMSCIARAYLENKICPFMIQNYLFVAFWK